MTDEAFKFWGIAIPSVTILISTIVSRVLSHYEHKKTGADITEIKLSINGELIKRINEAREEGRQQGIEESK